MTRVIYEDNVPVLRSDWYIEDIMAQAEEMDIALTKAEAISVMVFIAHTHDACIGINWDVIEEAIYNVKEEAGQS